MTREASMSLFESAQTRFPTACNSDATQTFGRGAPMDRARLMELALARLPWLQRGRSDPVSPAAAALHDVLPAAITTPARLPRVLVVDDNPIHRLLTGELLSLWGITPMQAADGAEAVALACGHEFDLILMDLQMPVLDGIAATAQIRRFETEQSARRVAVVAYTASPFSGSEPMLRACGMDAVLEKPCNAASLHACLCRWFPPMAAEAGTAALSAAPGQRPGLASGAPG